MWHGEKSVFSVYSVFTLVIRPRGWQTVPQSTPFRSVKYHLTFFKKNKIKLLWFCFGVKKNPASQSDRRILEDKKKKRNQPKGGKCKQLFTRLNIGLRMTKQTLVRTVRSHQLQLPFVNSAKTAHKNNCRKPIKPIHLPASLHKSPDFTTASDMFLQLVTWNTTRSCALDFDKETRF